MRSLSSLSTPAFLLALCALSPALWARDAAAPRTLELKDYLEWESVADPQIAPDATRIVYTRRWVNKLKDGWDAALWLVEVDGTKNRFLANGAGARWSPDGTRVAYLAEGEPEGTQIFVRWMDADGATTQITRVTQTPGDLHWSPDGRSIAFTMMVPRKPSWTIDMPAAPRGASWTDPPRLIETMHFRQDRRGFLKDGYTHLFVVDAEGGTPRQITEGDWDVGSRTYGIFNAPGFDWTPDGRAIVFDGLRDEPDLERYMMSNLYAVDVKTREIRQLTSADGPWTGPAVSPDGRSVAFIGYEWTPQTYHASDVWVIGIDGGKARKISADLDRDPDALYWAPDGSGVYFSADDRGSTNVVFASLDGRLRRVTEGAQILGLSSIGRDGMAAGVRSAPHEPPDVVRFPLTRPGPVTPVTHVNEDLLSGMTLGAVDELLFTSKDGTKVQGWVVKPPDFDPKKQYPLILHIHGGPHSMYGVGFSFSFQQLAANGYLVLYTNPRGSTGYGTAFGNAIDDAYPSVDFDDLMAGVDAVIAKGWVEPKRLYVTGVSGGGVLSSWITSHTDRFAAAAVRSPVIDWISFAGTTDVVGWGYFRFRGRFWEDPSKWLDHSPLMHVAKVKTPTLLMTGELDLRTPIGQTEEYYEALKVVGVPTAMLRFNGEYHGTGSKPSNFMRTQLYLLGWFARYSGAGG